MHLEYLSNKAHLVDIRQEMTKLLAFEEGLLGTHTTNKTNFIWVWTEDKEAMGILHEQS